MRPYNLIPVFTKIMFTMAALVFIGRLAIGQTWVQQTSGTTKSLNAVYFLDVQYGAIVGDAGTILYTFNAGQTWLPITGVTMENLNDFAFLNTSAAIVVGDGGRIFRSTNTGTYWVQIPSGTTSNLETVFFGTGGMVYAAGSSGTILRSSNDGLSWGTVTADATTYRSASAKNTTGVWIVGNDGVITASINSGVSFSLQASNTLSDLHVIFMLNDLTGYAGGENNTMLYTNNRGTEWTSRSAGINQGVNGIHFSNTNTGWAVCNAGAVYTTKNAGVTWSAENSGITTGLNDIYFPDINRGWAVGASGKIIYRTGTIGIIKQSDIAPGKFSLKQNYPNPFNPITNITFDIAVSGFVSLKVFDITGNKIADLVNEDLRAGTYQIEWFANDLSSGVYVYTLKSEKYSETKKMILTK